MGGHTALNKQRSRCGPSIPAEIRRSQNSWNNEILLAQGLGPSQIQQTGQAEGSQKPGFHTSAPHEAVLEQGTSQDGLVSVPTIPITLQTAAQIGPLLGRLFSMFFLIFNFPPTFFLNTLHQGLVGGSWVMPGHSGSLQSTWSLTYQCWKQWLQWPMWYAPIASWEGQIIYQKEFVSRRM